MRGAAHTQPYRCDRQSPTSSPCPGLPAVSPPSSSGPLGPRLLPLPSATRTSPNGPPRPEHGQSPRPPPPHASRPRSPAALRLRPPARPQPPVPVLPPPPLTLGALGDVNEQVAAAGRGLGGGALQALVLCLEVGHGGAGRRDAAPAPPPALAPLPALALAPALARPGPARSAAPRDWQSHAQ